MGQNVPTNSPPCAKPRIVITIHRDPNGRYTTIVKPTDTKAIDRNAPDTNIVMHSNPFNATQVVAEENYFFKVESPDKKICKCSCLSCSMTQNAHGKAE
ncbi:unnamed protein product [Rotaria magnacalcarata]|uniref:Uncharacterized protein n=1 Tax=Rotaria magnacalcarata TaxID=392030 RepID=A0A815X173_9BILA|nr:unnamed protein product [Rotaria magnacalcarata]CAF1549135.1 unnamed protein product [Rotaria magnacalcarata]CAF2214606.1 unnamed protein product [Rotaria magnacalcarata]CAF3808016.1 unnamed protein product [Rotaria magnacalcarata]CAF3885872.1 unnamed protein product [Rotaria magnacalcarata]